MSTLVEARKKLFNSIGEDTKHKYMSLLRNWFRQTESMSKIEFNLAVRQILQTEAQFQFHIRYMLCFYEKGVPEKLISMKLFFEIAQLDQKDTIPSISPKTSLPPNNYDKLAAKEFIMPDKNFIMTQLEYHLWEWAMDGAEEKVSDLLVVACQLFVKNIISSMISKKSSYKIKKSGFQYSYSFPAPDPLLRNSNNIMDHSLFDKLEFKREDDEIFQNLQPTLERAEQQAVFGFACGRDNYTNDKLTVDLLYDTLLEHPILIGLHSINSTNILKIQLHIDEHE